MDSTERDEMTIMSMKGIYHEVMGIIKVQRAPILVLKANHRFKLL